MDVNANREKNTTWGKLAIVFPILYACYLLFSCLNQPEKEPFRSTAPIPVFLVRDSDAEYKVIIEGDNNQQPVLGTFEDTRDGYRKFIPTFPFSPGQTYEIIENGKDYLSFIPKYAEKINPSATDFIRFYPEVDTVPENLLKMYISFSTPIDATQQILDHIKVYDVQTKEVKEIFLALENELWNAERTEVTLRLDPGRIKKDLIPNKERGNPIIKRRTYEVVLTNTLRNVDGQRVGTARKQFTVGARDEIKPDINKWQLRTPSRGAKDGLTIEFNDVLDAKLFVETTKILNAANEEISGELTITKNARTALFIPNKPWVPGRYLLSVESRLEDLAGNNLNRLFDVDLQKVVKADDSEIKKRWFVIK